MADESKLQKVYRHFPGTEYVIAIETDLRRIANDLTSKGVTTWGQGPIGETGYFKLVQCSPQHKGDKQFLIVASIADVEKARKLNV